MKYRLGCAILVVSFLGLTLSASARDVVLPAGTLLQCTLNEPNFSSATVALGDPVLCHLRGMVEFGQQVFPRGRYLVGHLESAKDPGHVDRERKIDGKGHAKRDVVEWMLPPLWPWKVIMLPARGPHPKLKGKSTLTLRLMDDVDIPQVAETYGPGWHFFGQRQSEPFRYARPTNGQPEFAVLKVGPTAEQSSQAAPQAAYATYVWRDDANPTTNVADVPGMPVFVLNTGTVLSVSAYGYRDKYITYTLASGGEGVISSDEVDWNTTARLNAQRGVRVTLHTERGMRERCALTNVLCFFLSRQPKSRRPWFLTGNAENLIRAQGANRSYV